MTTPTRLACVTTIALFALGCSGKGQPEDSHLSTADSGAVRDTRDSNPPDDSGIDTGPSDRDHDGVPDADDCGPDDPVVHAGAVEVCQDDKDNDCDGWVDHCIDDVTEVADSTWTISPKSPYEAFGIDVAWCEGLAGGSARQLLVASYAYQERPAVWDIPFEVGGIHDVDAEATGFVLSGADYEPLAASVTCPGDLNGDGFPDLVVGSPGGDCDSHVDLFYGPMVAGLALADADVRWTSDPRRCSLSLGSWVTGPGDVTDDGVADLIVGLDGGVNGNGEQGTLLSSPVTTGGYMEAAGTSWAVNRATSSMGGAALGDVDGDGIADGAIGAFADDEIGETTLFLLGSETLKDSIDPGARAIHSRFPGYAGDVNGDGYNDVWLAHQSGDTLNILYGPPPDFTDTEALPDKLWGYVSDAPNISMGAGDIDGDGFDDVVTADDLSPYPSPKRGPLHDDGRPGNVFVIPGPVYGRVEIDAVAFASLSGPDPTARLGWSLETTWFNGKPLLAVTGAWQAYVVDIDNR